MLVFFEKKKKSGNKVTNYYSSSLSLLLLTYRQTLRKKVLQHVEVSSVGATKVHLHGETFLAASQSLMSKFRDEPSLSSSTFSRSYEVKLYIYISFTRICTVINFSCSSSLWITACNKKIISWYLQIGYEKEMIIAI